MDRIIALFCLVGFFMLGNAALAGTIYTWTDADGVKRYSNAQPPEDAQDFEIINEFRTDQDHSDQLRQEYDRMVEEASQEADRHFEEQSERKAKARQAAQQQKDEKHIQQLEQERQKLQKELEGIRNRGLGPTFSTGQKEHLIKQVQDKLDQLDKQLEP
ncbi:uncharacterized protein Dvar_72480 [Desulfosarcina variabilis str. Montpellier]